MKQIQNSKTARVNTVREKEDARVVAALKREAGLEIESVYDLVNDKGSYPDAIPVLIALLKSEELTDSLIVQGIVRALTVREAKGKANDVLLDLFDKSAPSEDSLKWAIGNAIGFLLRPDDFERAKELVLDRDNGTARQGVVSALGKIKTVESEALLSSLLDDPEVTAHAIEGLRLMKAKNVVDQVKDLSNSKTPLVKRKALAFLKAADSW